MRGGTPDRRRVSLRTGQKYCICQFEETLDQFIARTGQFPMIDPFTGRYMVPMRTTISDTPLDSCGGPNCVVGTISNYFSSDPVGLGDWSFPMSPDEVKRNLDSKMDDAKQLMSAVCAEKTCDTESQHCGCLVGPTTYSDLDVRIKQGKKIISGTAHTASAIAACRCMDR